MLGKYDVQQVCENGHQITDRLNIRPEQQKKFCDKCGAPTITACPSCKGDIQGTQLELSRDLITARRGHSKIVGGFPVNVPSYCSNCGKPYPWTEKKIRTAIQIFVEFGDLNEE